MRSGWFVPAETEPLVAVIVARAAPDAMRLFGSRARGDHRPDSGWDLAVFVNEMASPELPDPMTDWTLKKFVGVEATIITAMVSDDVNCCGEPNTLGYDLARDGRRLDVGRQDHRRRFARRRDHDIQPGSL